jgi:predicted nucleic acid-binding protein
VTLLPDTNVVSELRKLRAGKADPLAAWGRAVPGASLKLSVIVVLELEIGHLADRAPDPRPGRVA